MGNAVFLIGRDDWYGRWHLCTLALYIYTRIRFDSVHTRYMYEEHLNGRQDSVQILYLCTVGYRKLPPTPCFPTKPFPSIIYCDRLASPSYMAVLDSES